MHIRYHRERITMNYRRVDSRYQKEVTKLFTTVFTESEGKKEGTLIGKLVSELASNIDDADIICYCAFDDNDSIVGSVFFTRLRFKKPIQVYMLAPVAVSTEHQGKGIGQNLINYGLDELKNDQINVVVTYGDPSYYSKSGFEPLSEKVIQAPLDMSMPVGWLGQSLSDEPIPVINERPTCVKAFNDSVYW